MWDQHQLIDLLSPFEVVEEKDFTNGVVIVPGRFHTTEEDFVRFDNFIRTVQHAVVIVTSDEESLYPAERLDHDNIDLWVMTPKLYKVYPGGTRFIGSLVPNHLLNATPLAEPDNDYFFSGQVTHAAREQVVNSLRASKNKGAVIESPGFTQGLQPDNYADEMRNAKFLPCPPGPITPDSFRFYEALEAGNVPVLCKQDEKYWKLLFGKLPPVLWVNDWSQTSDAINAALNNWLPMANRCYAWWREQKYFMRRTLIRQLGFHPPAVSFLVASSPIHSHPSTEIIDETIESLSALRKTNEPLFVMFDGIRNEQTKFRDVYQQFIRNCMINLADDPDFVPVLMRSHQHQARMTAKTLRLVESPLICFMEHDTPLVNLFDHEAELIITLLTDQLDLIRFAHEASILEPHQHLMIDHDDPETVLYLRTVQWSQRPHLARTEFYRRILNWHFPKTSRTMIEDVMHGIVQDAWHVEGLEGWNKYRLAIYAGAENIKRSTHTDGRGAEPKFEMKLK